MNNFQSIDSGQGMLKNDYEPNSSALDQALKKRREKLANTKRMTPQPDKDMGETAMEEDLRADGY